MPALNSSGARDWRAQSTSSEVRIGDAERDSATSELADHHVQGRVSAAEFEDRLDQVVRSKTLADLRRVFADLPPPPDPTLALPVRISPYRAALSIPEVRAHATAYTAVIVGLWGVWAASGAGFPWPVFPMLGWGSGLYAHTVTEGHRRARALSRRARRG